MASANSTVSKVLSAAGVAGNLDAVSEIEGAVSITGNGAAA